MSLLMSGSWEHEDVPPEEERDWTKISGTTWDSLIKRFKRPQLPYDNAKHDHQ